ncbi:MAG TPA: hypothetical protein DER09_00925 [Prolixibacteraceae bacterium]|nr:hypothetical protein [Prolixibacteraceae bacterium]
MKKITLLPYLVLLAGILLTELITISSFTDLKLIKQQAFENTCQDYKNKILNQLNANAQVLYSSAAYISSSDSITRDEWKLFQFQNKSVSELPGIQGIGFIKKIQSGQLDQFEKLIQKEGFPDFRVKPEGPREFYTSVLYIEPFSGSNLLAFGFDAFTEPVRKKAMVLAERSNAVVISDKVFLLQDSVSEKSPGTIMFVPVFKNYSSPANNNSSQYLAGWVFSPFRMNDLITGITGKWKNENLNLTIYDNEGINPGSVLFSSDSVCTTNQTNHYYSLEMPLVFNGKTWTLHFTKYQSTPDYFSFRVVAVFSAGIFMSFLLFILAINWLKMKTKSDEIFILNQELEKSNLNKDRFISVMAHDLRSPFNTLLGFTDLLYDKFEQLNQNEQKTYSKYIHNSAHSIFRLLDDLLTWARLDTGKFPFHPAKTDLSEICKTVIADYAIVAMNKKIQLETENMNVPHIVYADNMMLKTILRNLVDNAIKFSPENGIVKIRLTQAENKITISVSDRGIGMTAEEKAKLFNISTISSKPGTANEKGTGMGLILCSDLVKKHNGSIWVESVQGSGTTVSFSLPVG